MNPHFSVYLDLMRFFAAVIVVLSHFAYPRFSDGDYMFLRELNVGSDAVIIFFVLSGLVIAYTAQAKDRTLSAFSYSRLTRLYSVVVPALILTVVLDLAGRSLHPAGYVTPWYNDLPAWELLLRGWSFSNEWFWWGRARLGSNGPYWSLSYEAAYYILFAVAFYLKGAWKWPVSLFALLVFGPAVIALFPVWLMGVAVYRYGMDRDLSARMAGALFILPPVLYALFLAAGLPPLLLGWTQEVLSPRKVTLIFGFSNEFIWNTLLGLLVAAHLTGAASLYRRAQRPVSETFERAVRWLAGASFTIYVVHYPALQFFDAALPETMAAPLRHFLLLLLVMALCFAFAEVSERRLGWLRRRVKLLQSRPCLPI